MRLLSENKVPIPLPTTPTPCRWSRWNDVITVDGDYMVVFNTLAQTAVLLRKEEYVPLERMPQETFDTLYQLGIIVANDKDETGIAARRFEEGKHDLSYLDLTILLTQQCQFRCVYCFEGTKKDIELDEDTSCDIIRFLESKSDGLKKLRVTWFGGEPLLAFARLKTLSQRLIAFCEQHHINYIADMVTNGYNLTEERCRELTQDLRIKRYIITLDGPAPMHDKRRPLRSGLPTFNKVWDNITALVEIGALVNLRMTIDRENLESIPALLDKIASGPFARKTGLSFCRTMDYDFTPDTVQEVIFNEREFADIEWGLIQYAHQLGLWGYRFPHSAPLGGCLRRGDIVIGTRGEIFKCLDTVGDERWISGHITGEDTNHPEWYAQWLNWSPTQSASCRVCVLQPLCNGGCPHNALFTDKKHGNTTQCPDWKANYKRQIIELAKEYITRNNLSK